MHEDMLDAQAKIRGGMKGNSKGGEVIHQRSVHWLRAATSKEDSIIRARDKKTHGANLGNRVGIGLREKNEVVRAGKVV